MFLDNYSKWMRQQFNGTAYTSYVNTAGESIRGYIGAVKYEAIGQYTSPRFYAPLTDTYTGTSPTNLYPGVYFGTGITPAASDDYTMESPITGGLTALYYNTVTMSDAPGVYSISTVYTLRNTSDSEINISEIGWLTIISTFSTTTGYSRTDATWEPVLMERTVLDEPINIKPGEVKAITYKLTFNHNAA